ncbi:MAG: putative membrane protein, partial [Flavobacteriales bacterium]
KHELNPFNTTMIPAGTVVNVPRPTYAYIFMSGVIGICAMVLPGVSGSFFLLVLGVYQFMLSGALKGFVGSLVHGQVPVIQAPYVIVFCAGCLFGVLTFARVMSFLFKRFPSNTMAAMIGLMLGSLRALWPFKIGEPHTGVQNVMPVLDGTLVAPTMALVVGAGLVLMVTWLGSRMASAKSDTSPPLRHND